MPKPGASHQRLAGLLSPADRELLGGLARRHDRVGRWATALLALGDGLTQTAAAERAGLSERQVRAWQHAWTVRGPAIFPPAAVAGALADAPGGRAVEPAAATPTGAAEPAPKAAKRRRAKAQSDPDRLTPDDTVATAARKAIRRHFDRLRTYEDGTRSGEDPEDLHQMRVSTRRMRATLDVCAPALDAAAVRPFAKDLRRLARRLGAVRDLDVFGEHNATYLASLPAAEAPELEPLLAAWRERRAAARDRLLGLMEGDRYRRLEHALAAYVEDDAAGEPAPFGKAHEPRPRLLRHLVPAFIYGRLAAVRAYEPWLPPVTTIEATPLDRYHALRIATKRLRYALEVFADVLGPAAGEALAALKRLQEHLGELQDAVVACHLLRDFLVWGTWDTHPDRIPLLPILAPAITAYLATRQRDLERLIAGFPSAWAAVASAELRHHLRTAVDFLEDHP
jgi:CHAD domain-containing protein